MIYALSFDLEAQVELLGSKNESVGLGLNSGKRSTSHSNTHSREDVLARFNDHCSDFVSSETGEASFFGVTEGILLAEDAHARGYETESWVLDEGMAPHERDWLAQEKSLSMTAYFQDEASCKRALEFLNQEYRLKKAPEIKAEEEQDWNAKWKASFTGIIVDESLKVLPPWSEELIDARAKNNLKGIIAINPGAGFGTGTHETTQLCLTLLKEAGDLKGKIVLDFGSGSGILGIAAALQGAEKVYCVEIDPMANDNARENAALNGVESKIEFLEQIPSEIKNGKVDVLLANILRPILLRFAPMIKDCLKLGTSELVLSGLIESDLEQVISTYQEGGAPFEIKKYEKNEWRALWLRRKPTV